MAMTTPTRRLLIAAAALAAAGLLAWRLAGPSTTPPRPQPAAAPVAVAAPEPAPADTPRLPVVAPPATEPPAAALPALDASDALAGAALAALLPGFGDLFEMRGFIRRLVATVDNLPRERAATRLWPVRRVAGLPLVSGAGAGLALDGRNAERYARYVALAEALEPAAAMAVYARLYPLFQAAYRDLGYPQGHFNDRLVAVIDHLLAAPEIDGPLGLVQPRVLYRYADAGTEALSAGHKIMIRMGPGNARRVKARLAALRAGLAAAATTR